MRWMCLVCVLWGAAVVACGNSESQAAPSETGHAAEGEQAVYECPMKCKLEGHDEPYTQAEPGTCPVCGMDLQKKK